MIPQKSLSTWCTYKEQWRANGKIHVQFMRKKIIQRILKNKKLINAPAAAAVKKDRLGILLLNNEHEKDKKWCF